MNLPGGIALEGICFRARRTGNGQNGDGRRGVRGSGGSEGRKEDEASWRRCSAREISWGRSSFSERSDGVDIGGLRTLAAPGRLPCLPDNVKTPSTCQIVMSIAGRQRWRICPSG